MSVKTDSDLIEELRQVATGRAGRQARWCREKGVAEPMVSNLLHGRMKTVPTSISLALGYRMVRSFVRVGDG
jgi:hypothetical protein